VFTSVNLYDEEDDVVHDGQLLSHFVSYVKEVDVDKAEFILCDFKGTPCKSKSIHSKENKQGHLKRLNSLSLTRVPPPQTCSVILKVSKTCLGLVILLIL
jgi:hypothetical protein